MIAILLIDNNSYSIVRLYYTILCYAILYYTILSYPILSYTTIIV